MMHQILLKNHTRRTDPQTSKGAFLRANVPKQCQDVFEEIREFNRKNPKMGFTIKDLESFTGKDRHIYGRRFSDLKKLGLIEEDKERETRLGCRVFKISRIKI